MSRFQHAIQLTLSSVRAAAEAWAAAAGQAGAYAPAYIARRLIASVTRPHTPAYDLLWAAVDGCRDALRRHQREGRSDAMQPRGCEVGVDGSGVRSIIWESTTHICTICHLKSGSWHVMIDSDRLSWESSRCIAAVIGAWKLSTSTEDREAVCDAARHVFPHAVPVLMETLDSLAAASVLCTLRRVGDDGETRCGDVLHYGSDADGRPTGIPSLRLCGRCSSSVDVLDSDERIIGTRMLHPDGCGNHIECEENSF